VGWRGWGGGGRGRERDYLELWSAGGEYRWPDERGKVRFLGEESARLKTLGRREREIRRRRDLEESANDGQEENATTG
jgi:hypothetical protein